MIASESCAPPLRFRRDQKTEHPGLGRNPVEIDDSERHALALSVLLSGKSIAPHQHWHEVMVGFESADPWLASSISQHD